MDGKVLLWLSKIQTSNGLLSNLNALPYIETRQSISITKFPTLSWKRRNLWYLLDFFTKYQIFSTWLLTSYKKYSGIRLLMFHVDLLFSQNTLKSCKKQLKNNNKKWVILRKRQYVFKSQWWNSKKWTKNQYR